MSEIRSFDVFDTCLTRRIAVPSDLFYDVAQMVYLHLGLTPNRALIEDFVAARIEAERIARERALLEDITLAGIWEILQLSMGWASGESLQHYELKAEEDSLCPIKATRVIIQTLRQQGYRIVFVSDMYLPSEFIERLLQIHGFAEQGDGMYVSGEIGKMKISGNLFKYVLDQENIQASQLLHFGDNRHSDYTVPLSLGIRAELVQESQTTDNELRLLKNSRFPQASSKLVGAMRAFRSEQDSGYANISELVSQFIGPFVMGFAVWVLKQAQAQGIRRLYFLSRDCQLLWKVARELSPMFGEIECKYLYVSRQALYLPSATEISSEGMPWMRRSFEEPILKNLLAKIEMTYDDISSLMVELAGDQREKLRLKSDQDWKRFWEIINQNPIKYQVDSLINRRREETRLYYQSQGLFEDTPWAIVDLGWYLTGQRSLWTIMKQFGWNKKIRGFYLALKNGRCSSAAAGLSEALIYEGSPHLQSSQLESSIFQYQTLLEHIIGCADHPTVHHYDVDGSKVGPVFVSSIDDSTKDFAAKLHSTVIDFVAKNIHLVEYFKNPDFCRETLSSITCNSFKYPTENSAKAIQGLSIAIDQNELDLMPIVKKLTLDDLLKHYFPERYLKDSGSSKQPFFWLEGSLAITSDTIKSKFNKIKFRIKLLNKLTMKLALRSRARKLLHI